MRILVVDDDVDILEILVASLHAFGHTTVTAATSAKAAAKVIATAEVPFDCLLLDVMMPEVDGIELCRSIRKIAGYRSTPIIMVTALSDKMHIDRAFLAGATDFVMKPFDPMELHGRILAADKQVEANRLVRETGAEMKAMRADLLDSHRFALSDAIHLEDVDGLVDQLALENYLLLGARGALFSTCTIVFRILGVGDIFAQSSGPLFRDILSDVAESALAAFSGASRIMAYVGNGTFAAVLSGGTELDSGDVELMINAIISGLDLVDDQGRALNVQVVVGEPMRNGALTSGRLAVNQLHQGIEDIGWTSHQSKMSRNQQSRWPGALIRALTRLT